MNTIALVSTDERITSEVAAAAAVVGATVRICSSCHEVDISDTEIVLLDARSQGQLQHSNIAIVCFGPAGPEQWMAASMRGAQRIIELPHERAALTELLDGPSAHSRTTIAILPAISGCGSSTLSVALAAHLSQRGHHTLLIDGDTNGGLDIVAGIESVAGARWCDVLYDNRATLILPSSRELQVLSSDLRNSPCEPNVEAVTRWTDTAEVVLWDLPVQGHEMLARINPDFVVTVVPNTVRAVALARRSLAHTYDGKRGVVVRSVTGAAIEPREISTLLNVPLWGVVPSDNRVVEQVEQGLGPAAINLGGYTRAVLAIVDQLVGNAAEL